MPAHINAYIEELGNAREALRLAQGEVQRTEAALKAHPDYVAPPVEPKKVGRPKLTVTSTVTTGSTTIPIKSTGP